MMRDTYQHGSEERTEEVTNTPSKSATHPPSTSASVLEKFVASVVGINNNLSAIYTNTLIEQGFDTLTSLQVDPNVLITHCAIKPGYAYMLVHAASRQRGERRDRGVHLRRTRLRSSRPL